MHKKRRRWLKGVLVIKGNKSWHAHTRKSRFTSFDNVDGSGSIEAYPTPYPISSLTNPNQPSIVNQPLLYREAREEDYSRRRAVSSTHHL
jgi:hypothetical protein